jgi:hypothetical protein
MDSGLLVTTGIQIDQTCSIRCEFDGTFDASITFAEAEHILGISIHPEALRELIEVGSAALAEEDARYAADDEAGSIPG